VVKRNVTALFERNLQVPTYTNKTGNMRTTEHCDRSPNQKHNSDERRTDAVMMSSRRQQLLNIVRPSRKMSDILSDFK